MLRGNSPAKLDAKGRIKIPTLFRKYIEEKYGREFFVTSTDGEYVRVYPLPVLVELEKRLAPIPTMNPAVENFKEAINYYGQPASMDDQGRILIHPLLRRTSGIDGEVSVLGKLSWLDIWDRNKIEAIRKAQPITKEEKEILASFGI